MSSATLPRSKMKTSRRYQPVWMYFLRLSYPWLCFCWYQWYLLGKYCRLWTSVMTCHISIPIVCSLFTTNCHTSDLNLFMIVLIGLFPEISMSNSSAHFLSLKVRFLILCGSDVPKPPISDSSFITALLACSLNNSLPLFSIYWLAKITPSIWELISLGDNFDGGRGGGGGYSHQTRH